MLFPSEDLLQQPIMSLQTGGQIAQTIQPIINPHNLHILAYELDGQQLDERPAFMRIEDIRELSDVGFIVNSSDEITILEDLVINKELYENPFALEKMHVIDDNGSKLGRISRCFVDTDSFRIEKFSVKQPILKRISDTELIINRSQIINITNDTVTVRSPKEPIKQPAKLEKQPFINPFRGHTPPQPESVKSDHQ